MKKIVLVAGLAAALLMSSAVPSLAVSGAGAIALVFPIGARYAAMGEAGVALSADATANWWNPGGLAFLSKHDVHLMQSKLAASLADDIALYWLGYATPSGPGTLGVNFNYLTMGEQEATDEEGVSQGFFSSYMFAFGAAYGVKVLPNLGFGLGIKYFRDRLAPDDFLQDKSGGSGDSFGVDFGLHYRVPGLRMNLAAAVANLGPNIKHVDADQSDPMPRRATVGMAYGIFDSEVSSLLVVTDYLVPLLKWDETNNDYGFGLEFDEEEYGYGLEWSYVHSLFLRFGYKSARAGDIHDSTWGFGVDLTRWLGRGVKIDYASVPQATGLDRVNRFSLGFRF
jgi:hypothetical protein